MGLFQGLFGVRDTQPPGSDQVPMTGIPVAQVDLGKRYDVYYEAANEERLYEDVRFLGVRTFDRLNEYSSGLVCGYLEVETAEGSRLLLRSYGIHLICEHGTRPVFQVLRSWGGPGDD